MVRLALGAVVWDILGLVLRQGLLVAAMGALGGDALSCVWAPLLRSLLYGVGPADPLTLAAVITTLIFVDLAAAYGLARRATRLGPSASLRVE